MLFCRLNDEYGVCLVVSLKIACWNMTLVFMVNVASQFEDCVSGFRCSFSVCLLMIDNILYQCKKKN